MSLSDTLSRPRGVERFLDGQLAFAGEEGQCPAGHPAGYPGYWIWRGRLYRNGEEWGTVLRYWWDRDVLGWWVDYRPFVDPEDR